MKFELLISLGLLWPVLVQAKYEYYKALDPDKKYHLFWTPTEDKIIMEIQVETLGWVGLGFSPNGGMTGSDVIMAWVKDGEVYFQDRYAFDEAQPLIDDQQNYELIKWNENSTHTTIAFSRVWDTCDDENDFLLSADTVRVIWAYNSQDPADINSPIKHEHRGATSVVLTGTADDTFVPTDDVTAWHVHSVNYQIPHHQDTTYYCQVVRAPDYIQEKPHHIVAVSDINR